MASLSARTCETAKPLPDRDRLLGDGNGLVLRIRPNGTKTWVIEYKYAGHRRKQSVGVYDRNGSPGDSITAWLEHGRLSPAQARSIASHWKAERRAGRDPVAEWEARKAEKLAAAEAARHAAAIESQQPSVRDAVDLFMAKHIAGKKSAPAIRYRLDRLLAALGGQQRMCDVTRKDIVAALDSIAEGRKEGRSAKQLAGEVLVQAQRLWRFAESREWVASSCIERLARKDFDARPRKRDVDLGLDEVAALWKALDDPIKCKADPVTKAALRLTILTGQREREVTDSEWTEFDLDAGIWKLPAHRTKSRRAHVVHLAPQAIAILRQLESATGKQRHVFASSLRTGKPIWGRSVNNALQIMFKRAALRSVTPCHVHDLRRTLITRLPDLGIEPFIGHKIANHVLPGILAHYNHNEYLPQRREALHKWADRIERLATSANVVSLHRAA